MSGFNNPAETWNKRFSGADYIFGTQANTWLTQQASHMPKSGRVLAVADGEGRNSIWLAQQANNQGLPAVVCARLSLACNDDLRRRGLQTCPSSMGPCHWCIDDTITGQ